jgi:S-(hydroxymethyl)glutathione dehydrogenase/alcohol dehydrogenase
MRAVVIHDYEKGPSVESVDIDDPRPDEVKVRIAASGVCGSDMHVLHGRSVVAALPMVIGHEGSGIVEAVGRNVVGVQPGDHVVVALYGPCGACGPCRSGDIVQCNGGERTANIFGRRADGTTTLQQNGVAVHPMVGVGSLSEHVVVRATQVVVIPDEVPLDVICLAGCGVTTGLGAVFNTARVIPGASVAVVGCGGVGLNVIQAARLAGAGTIVALDTNPSKLDLALRFGATHIVDTTVTDLREGIAAAVPGGVDYSFEVVGSPALVASMFEATRPGGTTVMVGSPPAGQPIPIDGRALFSERRLLGTIGGGNIPGRDIPRIVALYRAGKIDLDGLVSQRLPLDRVAEAFTAADNGTAARSVITME